VRGASALHGLGTAVFLPSMPLTKHGSGNEHNPLIKLYKIIVCFKMFNHTSRRKRAGLQFCKCAIYRHLNKTMPI
jgi:hypothetical protein